MAQAMDRLNERVHQKARWRSHAEVMRFFNGLDMVDPGLVAIHQWRPETNTDRIAAGWCGVARKP